MLTAFAAAFRFCNCKYSVYSVRLFLLLGIIKEKNAISPQTLKALRVVQFHGGRELITNKYFELWHELRQKNR